jgi:hypothetical protein
MRSWSQDVGVSITSLREIRDALRVAREYVSGVKAGLSSQFNPERTFCSKKLTYLWSAISLIRVSKSTSDHQSRRRNSASKTVHLAKADSL